jgi:hypothetical protein
MLAVETVCLDMTVYVGIARAGYRRVGNQRHYFRSAWEANYARYLEWLREHGAIQAWNYEPRCFWFNQPKTINGKRLVGVKRGVVSYLPDFEVMEKNGAIGYYEVKGHMDGRSKTKIARMRRYYPEFPLIVIGKRQYGEIASKVGALISGWE